MVDPKVYSYLVMSTIHQLCIYKIFCVLSSDSDMKMSLMSQINKVGELGNQFHDNT